MLDPFLRAMKARTEAANSDATSDFIPGCDNMLRSFCALRPFHSHFCLMPGAGLCLNRRYE